MGAGFSGLVLGRGLILGAEGIATAAAEDVILGLEGMIHRHPFIKYKAVPLPQALVGGDLFEVVENAALEVVDLVKAALA